MSKINVHALDGEGNLVSATDLVAAVTGVREGLQRLGGMRKAVKKVDVAYIYGAESGFKMVVHFADPLGNESYMATDYRFIGRKTPKPAAQEITDHFAGQHDLQSFMKEFLLKSRSKLRQARQELERQLNT